MFDLKYFCFEIFIGLIIFSLTCLAKVAYRMSIVREYRYKKIENEEYLDFSEEEEF